MTDLVRILLVEDNMADVYLFRKPPDLEEFLQIGGVVKDILLKTQAHRAGGEN